MYPHICCGMSMKKRRRGYTMLLPPLLSHLDLSWHSGGLILQSVSGAHFHEGNGLGPPNCAAS